MDIKQNEYKGQNGTLVLTDSKVTIKRKGFLANGNMRGDMSIPYSSITGIQFKKASFFSIGYLHFVIMGGQEINNIFQAGFSENTITFGGSKTSKTFEEAKEIIENRMTQSKQSGNTGIHDLEKLAELRDKGIISQQDFDKKKKQILGI